MNYFHKKPGARLDYYVDWSDWLPEGDQLYESSWTATSGIELSEESFDAASGVSTVWISGGKTGETHEAINSIVTTDNRQNEERIVIKIV